MRRSDSAKKIYTMIMAIVCCAAFVLTACQPTPEVAPVVNKRDEIPQDAVKEEGGEASGDAHFDQVEYEVTDHWKETLNPADFFTINADADVFMPAVEKIPVERIERFDLTQEKVNEFIAKLVPEGSKYYDNNIPLTKKYYEAYLIDMKQQMADLQAEGQTGDVQWMTEEITNIEKELEKAPEKNEKTYIDPVFSYQLNWETNEPDTASGENFINVAVENPDGSSTASIWATRFDPSYYYGPDFSYYGAMTESWKWYEDQEKYLLDEKNYEWINELENEKEREEQRASYEKEKAHIAALKEALTKNNIDLDAAKQQGIELLEEFGLTGVQITSCEKALYEKQENELDYEYTTTYEPKLPTGNACMIEFVRECGGIPCAVGSYGPTTDPAEWGSDKYSAPFYLETGTIVITEEGEVVQFSWNSGAQVVETVAADSELISFDEAKKRAADQWFYNNTYWYDEMSEEDRADYKPSYRFEIDKVELKMSYINAKDDPEKALVIPVWCFSGIGYDGSIWGDEEHDEYEMGRQEILISALDGGVVMEPGMARQYEDMMRAEEEMAGEEEAKTA